MSSSQSAPRTYEHIDVGKVKICVGRARVPFIVSRELLDNSAYFSSLLSGRWGYPSYECASAVERISTNPEENNSNLISVDCECNENTFEMVLAILRYKNLKCLPPLCHWELFRLRKELDFLGIEIEGVGAQLTSSVGASLPSDLGDPTLLVSVPAACFEGEKDDVLVSVRFGYLYCTCGLNCVKGAHPSDVATVIHKAVKLLRGQLAGHRNWAAAVLATSSRHCQKFLDHQSLLVTTSVPGCKCACGGRRVEAERNASDLRVGCKRKKGAVQSVQSSDAGAPRAAEEGEEDDSHSLPSAPAKEDAMWGVILRHGHIWCLSCKKQPAVNDFVPNIVASAAAEARGMLSKQYKLDAS